MSDVLVEMTTVVPAPADEVFTRVMAIARGGRHVEVDRELGIVAVQGGWWYRGEYEVSSVPSGTRLTHRVRNVAARGRWAVPLANRLFIGFRPKVRQSFTTFAASL